MIKFIVVLILVFGYTKVNAFYLKFNEFEENCLWKLDKKIKLLNEWELILEKSIYSYIPYHEKNSLIKTPEWMYNIYLEILKRWEGKYDVFYAYISDTGQCNLVLIKEDIVFLCTPYLKIPGSEKKIYDSGELKCMIEEVEEQLFKEENHEKVLELVRQLHMLKSAACEIEVFSKQLPSEITRLILKIMQTFKGLQSTDKTLNGYELEAIYDYMWDGEAQKLQFYGLNSSLFGASIQSITVPGSPGICVGRMFNNLARYVKSKPANEQSELDWLRMEMKELPFLRDFH